jgi:ubiquinone/menaquinone biosynthesis C-methylase UbiE
MSIKDFLLKLYYLPQLSKEATDANQRVIRDIEWDAIKKYIPAKAKFLDVGCGAGYAMKKAIDELECNCFGIDPNPGAHGVGRYNADSKLGLNIVAGFSESLPYNDNEFDVVYSSHVLEHVNDEHKSLEEMKRVLKPGGVLIIGMPTAAMAWINFLTDLLFTTHHRVFNVLFKIFPFITTGKTPFVNMLIPPSHSNHRAKTIFFDLMHYRVSNWKKIVSKVFEVKETLLPALYPYPQYWQLFKLRRNIRFSSSVFFICNK